MSHKSAPVRGAIALCAGLALLRCGAAPPEEESTTTVVPVEVAPIVKTTLRSYVEASGTVEPQPATPAGPSAQANVASSVGGLIAEIKCAEGGRVARGDLLFRLDTRVADVDVAQAVQAVGFAEAAFKRQEELGAGEATSKRLYQEAEAALASARSDLGAAQARRALLDVTAPLSGTIVSVQARLGDSVDPTTRLAQIVDLDRLVVTTQVRAAEIGRVKRGQVAELLDAAAPSSDEATPSGTVAAQGSVTWVSPIVDPTTDSVTVRASVPRGSGLRPGQFVEVRVLISECRDCLAAPVEGLVMEEGKAVLAVVKDDVATKREVSTGVREGSFVEVSGEGIIEGLTVVAAGAYGLPEETKIRVIQR
jgi:membrane fusion protein (multidrug efflux system)